MPAGRWRQQPPRKWWLTASFRRSELGARKSVVVDAGGAQPSSSLLPVGLRWGRVRGSFPRMRFLLVTIGTHGDVLPHIAIGARLQARGHQVTLAANAKFEKLTEASRDWKKVPENQLSVLTFPGHMSLSRSP